MANYALAAMQLELSILVIFQQLKTIGRSPSSHCVSARISSHYYANSLRGRERQISSGEIVEDIMQFDRSVRKQK
jgi:hypothetical protein